MSTNTTAKDPVCGVSVALATAVRAQRDGHPFFFCSERCRTQFLAIPASAVPAKGCCG